MRTLLIFARTVATLAITVLVLFTSAPPPALMMLLALIMVSGHLFAPGDVRAPLRVAMEVADDRELVRDIVQRYVGDPPDFDGGLDQAELERQIEVRLAGWKMTERGIQPKVEPVRPEPDELERVGAFRWPFVPKAKMAGVKKIVAAFEAGAIDHAECEALLSTYLGKGVKVARLTPITSLEDVPMFPCPDMEPNGGRAYDRPAYPPLPMDEGY